MQQTTATTAKAEPKNGSTVEGMPFEQSMHAAVVAAAAGAAPDTCTAAGDAVHSKSGNDVEDPGEMKPKKIAKRKVAMHLAYLGAGYHGMQRNPVCRTIEGELEAALVKAGAVSEQNAGSFHKIHWSRAARTDKGVSALCQVVSAKLVVEPKETFAERINQHLPDQVRVFGAQRATDGFDARHFCDKRKYEYILPAWIFDPQASVNVAAEPGNKAAKRTAAKGNSSARLADEAAALQAIAAAVLAAPAPQDSPSAAAGFTAPAAQEDNCVCAAAAGSPSAASISGGKVGGVTSRGGSAADGTSDSQPPQGGGKGGQQAETEDEKASTSPVEAHVLERLRQDVARSRQRFVFGQAQLQRLNGLLAKFTGTHSFHNYTVRVAASDAAARRYILSFKADLVDLQGQPWVRLVVVGQSFMLHQIRKMVGMVVAIMRGTAPEACLQLALDRSLDVHTPMAPALGLFLDETYFDAYNARFGDLHGPVTFDPYRQAAVDFKHRMVYRHIAELDEQELVNALWLRGCTDAAYRFTSWANQLRGHNGGNKAQQQQQQQAAAYQNRSAKVQSQKRKPNSSPSSCAAARHHQHKKQQCVQQPDTQQGVPAGAAEGAPEAVQDLLPHNGTQPKCADGLELGCQTDGQQGQIVEQRLNHQQQQGTVPEKQAQPQPPHHMQHPSSEVGVQPAHLQPVLLGEQQQLPPSPAAAAAAAAACVVDGDAMELESLYD